MLEDECVATVWVPAGLLHPMLPGCAHRAHSLNFNTDTPAGLVPAQTLDELWTDVLVVLVIPSLTLNDEIIGRRGEAGSLGMLDREEILPNHMDLRDAADLCFFSTQPDSSFHYKMQEYEVSASCCTACVLQFAGTH